VVHTVADMGSWSDDTLEAAPDQSPRADAALAAPLRELGGKRRSTTPAMRFALVGSVSLFIASVAAFYHHSHAPVSPPATRVHAAATPATIDTGAVAKTNEPEVTIAPPPSRPSPASHGPARSRIGSRSRPTPRGRADADVPSAPRAADVASKRATDIELGKVIDPF
jgi:hypothetical protein